MNIRFTSSAGQTNKFLFKKGVGGNKIEFISSTEPFSPPSGPVDTTLYDSEGIILDTVSGDVPESWKSFQFIAGYVDIGTSATSIGNYALSFNQLTAITIPNSVTSIGNYAFGYNQLTSVTIPDSVTSIGSKAFYNNDLTSVTIPDSMTSIENNVFGYNQLTSVTIPDSVTSIGDRAFYSNQLTAVTIPDSVTSIGPFAFYGNQLTAVTIPDSVTSIGDFAFSNNPTLATVNCYTTQTALGINAFLSTASPLTIHARATDATWTAGTSLLFQGNGNTTIIKDL